MNRSELKASAKASLRGNWGTVIGAAFVAAAAFLVVGVIHVMIIIALGNTDSPLEIATGVMLTASMFSMLYTLGGSVFTGGYNCLMLKISRNIPASIGDIFSRVKQTFKFFILSIAISIMVSLWTLLLIIPGIIATYRYSQVYFILCDHPTIGIFDAITLSKEIMLGHKMDLFVLSLSFLGWMMLCCLTLGIGLIWLIPYMNVTYANFYNKVMGEYNAKQSYTAAM